MEKALNDLAKTKLLKVETALGSIAISSSSSIDIQPSNTPLGLRLIERQGQVIPMALFDSKKMRNVNAFDGAMAAVDEALANFEKESS
jgi:hypothetical protein